MMKDMKWKQIDTTYAGKAYQVEAEEINLRGEVNITGSLSVNGGSINTPTAADVSYDNTTSGLTADDVQEAVDELAAVRVKKRTFTSLTEFAAWAIANYADHQIVYCKNSITNTQVTVNATSSRLNLTNTYINQGATYVDIFYNDGVNTQGFYIRNNDAPVAFTTTYDNATFDIWYV